MDRSGLALLLSLQAFIVGVLYRVAGDGFQSLISSTAIGATLLAVVAVRQALAKEAARGAAGVALA